MEQYKGINARSGEALIPGINEWLNENIGSNNNDKY